MREVPCQLSECKGGCTQSPRIFEPSGVEMENKYARGTLLSKHISLEAERYGNADESALGEEEGRQDLSSCPICFDVLMDPCSLNCGHTFCELCLATVWKTEAGNWTNIPRSILCPTCRNPTESFPQVNFAMRNMTESNPVIKQKVDERRSQITPQEAQLLDKVKEARRVNRQQAEANRTEDLRQHGRRVNLRFNVNLAGQRNNSALFGILICAGVTAFVLGLLLYGISFLYSGDSHEDFIATWSSDEVADWIIAEFPHWGVQLAEEMKEAKVDGDLLLKLSEDNLKDLGVENQFRQQTVLHYINHLKAGTAPRQPRSLTEFNEYYFRDAVLVVNLFKMGVPNVAIWILYFTNYEHAFLPFYHAATSVGVPPITSLWQGGAEESVERNADIPPTDGTNQMKGEKVDSSRPLSWVQLLLFWLMMQVVSPYVMVGKVALTWIFDSPIMASVVFVICSGRFYLVHLATLRMWRQYGTKMLSSYYLLPSVYAVFLYAIFSILWKILPTFVWTIVYYLLLIELFLSTGLAMVHVIRLWLSNLRP